QEGGIDMMASCCGHGKGPGRIDLADGRVLEIHATEQEYERVRQAPAQQPAPAPAEGQQPEPASDGEVERLRNRLWDAEAVLAKVKHADEVGGSVRQRPHGTSREHQYRNAQADAMDAVEAYFA